MGTPNVFSSTSRSARHSLDVPTSSPVRAEDFSSHSELARLVRGDLPLATLQTLKRLLRESSFDRREGITSAAAAELAYERARFLARSLRLTASELARDPSRLYALHEWVPLVDGVAGTVLSIHYCLAIGSIAVHGEDRPELEPFLAELERMDTCGVFLATELGYGNNVASLETEAVYHPEAREFILSSRTARSYKFMPNTAHALPRLAVVMARLVSQGRHHGVFPFLVRIRDENGTPCRGVRITALSEKPGYALDNGVTRFDGVRIPKAHLLAGPDSVLHDDGSFESRIPSRHRRFLLAMDRVQTGRVCFTSAVVACLRAASFIALRYTRQRLTFGPARRSVPLLAYRNVQRDVFGALASAYALTFAVRAVQRRFRARTPATEDESFRVVAALKATATSEVAVELVRLRERCGAVGMLSANRILEYWNQTQGVITAEGDNQLMQLKVGRQLLESGTPTPARPKLLADLATLDADRAVALFRFREASLQREILSDVVRLRTTKDPFAVWNQHVNGTLALATAYGERFVAECFQAVLDDVRDREAKDMLGRLFALWAVRVVERHAGWFLAESCLTNDAVKGIENERDRLCAAIEPDAEALAEAFGLDNALLRAPVAENDYVRAYDPWPSESERANTTQSVFGTSRSRSA
jgi:acyl-CoA oxidase